MAIVRGVLQLPPDSEQVTDADEEIFILYSHLQSSPSTPQGTFRGLGHLDSRQDTLSISFDLKSPPPPPPPFASKRTGRKSKSTPARIPDTTLELTLHQDKTALRTRKGDTGSVLWRVTHDFAQLVLQQLHARDPRGLFDAHALKRANVLELGAGTGLLSILLAPHVARYTATDVEELVPLMRKNAALNAAHLAGANLTIHPLDWVLLHNTPTHKRNALLPFPVPPALNTTLEPSSPTPNSHHPSLSSPTPSPHTVPSSTHDPTPTPLNLILALDTLYHPSLLPPLLTTLHHLATPGTTAALVVAELRAPDVLREFLEGWLALGRSPGGGDAGGEQGGKGAWEIHRVGSGSGVGGGLEGPYVMWVGWRLPLPNAETQT